jgi:hypothetical protein
MFLEKTDVVAIYSQNGEVHLILKENQQEDLLLKHKDVNLVEIKALMKKEAAKPLLLVRE